MAAIEICLAGILGQRFNSYKALARPIGPPCKETERKIPIVLNALLCVLYFPGEENGGKKDDFQESLSTITELPLEQ